MNALIDGISLLDSAFLILGASWFFNLKGKVGVDIRKDYCLVLSFILTLGGLVFLFKGLVDLYWE